LKESALDRLPGVGPKRKKSLLHFFGSMQALREAPPQQLALAPGFSKALAHKIYTALHSHGDEDNSASEQ
jgi:excinuclease ABC subunit C